jgi:hypothetical protein
MRSKTILGSVLAVLGVLLLAAAAVLTWVVVPRAIKFPADTDTTRQYNGTAKLIVQPSALAAGDQKRAVITNAPIQATDNIKVLATSGNTAQTRDTRTLIEGGQTVGMTQATYAVDRKSLEATTDHPSDWTVVPAQGLTVSWPIGAAQHDYTGWVSDTQTTTTLTFLRQETREGINTYVYQAKVSGQPIKDPQVLAGLPTSLPGNLLGALGSALPLPEQVKAQLAQLVPQLTQPVPLRYTYSTTATYWVEPNTGTVVDTQQEEIREASPGLPGGISAKVPVYDVVTRNTTDSVRNATNDATNDSDKITLYSRTLPLTFLAAGVVALVAGIGLIILGRRRSTVE